MRHFQFLKSILYVLAMVISSLGFMAFSSTSLYTPNVVIYSLATVSKELPNNKCEKLLHLEINGYATDEPELIYLFNKPDGTFVKMISQEPTQNPQVLNVNFLDVNKGYYVRVLYPTSSPIEEYHHLDSPIENYSHDYIEYFQSNFSHCQWVPELQTIGIKGKGKISKPVPINGIRN